ncbi:MAG: methionine gamma-lyase family protein [Bacillota bacterium]
MEELVGTLLEELGIRPDSTVGAAAIQAARDVQPVVSAITATAAKWQVRITQLFKRHRLSSEHFAPTTGYGYGDRGREVLEAVWADAFGGEAALVRPQIVSGTHAIGLCLGAVCRPGDLLVSALGEPYETVKSVIGLTGQRGSLADYGVRYCEARGEEELVRAVESGAAAVFIQRSGGYSQRRALSVAQIARLVSVVKGVNQKTVCIVDNCYGEFVEELEPSHVGADLVAGSLIKNPGGGLAPTGGYIVGREELIQLVAARLVVPGSRDLGPSPIGYRHFYQGLWIAPQCVGQALITACFSARLFELLGFPVRPKFDEPRGDIIQAIGLGARERLLAFLREVQARSPVDSHVAPEPWLMPGYQHEVAMAAGTFVQGSSIEFSADAPVMAPYEVYLQGGLSAAHGIWAVIAAAKVIVS